MDTWDVLKDNVKQAKILLTITEPCLSHEFQQEQLKNYHARKICVSLRGPVTWNCMSRNVWNDVVSCRTRRLNNSTKYSFATIISEREELKSVGELSKVCSQIVLKCVYLARIGRPDILWSVNKLARSITKWTKACGTRLSRLISSIHHTCDYRQCCHVGNTPKQCRMGLFQDSDFAGDLEDSKSTSGGKLCIFGSHTFVPISEMCKKQTSASHSSTESEIISLDAGLRLDGIPALDFWNLIVAVLHGNTYQNNQARWDLCTNQHEVRSIPHTIQKRKKSQGVINDLDNVDFFFVKRQLFSSRSFVKQWSKWLSREEALQWDMFPEPTELLLIGCSMESIWTPRSKSNTLTPRTNRRHVDQGELHTRWMESSFVFV